MAVIEGGDIVIRRAGGHYVAGIPKLGLYARGATAAIALDALEARKAALSRELADAGLDEPFAEPPPPPPQLRFLDAVGLFFAKALIVAVLLGVVFIGSAAFAIHRAQRAALDVMGPAATGGSAFWTGLEKDLHEAADPRNGLPEAKRQQLLADIRALVARWRPFVTEVVPLFERDGRSDVPPSPAARP
jgi:hypothetical protein